MAGHNVAERLQDALARLFGVEAPVRLRAWDGSEYGPQDAPVVHVRSRRALRRLLWRPDELGLARAYIAGEIDVEGELIATLEHVAPFGRRVGRDPDFSPADRRELLRTAVLLGAVGAAPKPPPEEAGVPRRSEPVHDRAAPRAHHDADNSFYANLLGSSLTYSCAYWGHPDAPDRPATLDAAQEAKFDAACRALGLTAGARLLDVGCGWGTFLLYAARHYGVTGVGVTVSAEQAELANKHVAEAGLEERVEVRVANWREVEDGPYDAISSIGTGDYLGAGAFAEYAATLAGLTRPGGRLFCLQTTSRKAQVAPERTFIDAYVFPDAVLMPLGTVVQAVEDAGLEVRELESVREHYARTLREWLSNLERRWETCVAQTSPGRARVWRLYLAVAALAFEAARLNAHQLVAVRPYADGRAQRSTGTSSGA